MLPRPSARLLQRTALAALLTLVTVTSTGCVSGLFTAMYFLKGNNTPAECNALKEKKVVVVCRSVTSLQYTEAGVEQQIAEEVGSLLKQNVSKVKLVPHRKVAEWMDEKEWNEFVEVGKALEADMVVGIDLEQFNLREGQTLYQGKAAAEIKVYDCKKGDLVFRKRLPRAVYPPNRVISVSEKTDYEFRQEFVKVLSDQIARHFYDHDPYADFALDAKDL